jgi:hypothetical protein
MNENQEQNTDFDERLTFSEYENYDLSVDAELDKYALDIEAEHQAHLYQKWSELLVQAQAKLSNIKEKIANLEAHLLVEGKINGITVGDKHVGKPTDPTVKAWIQTNKRYKRLTAKRRIAENNVAYLQNSLKVLEHKRSMIRTESDLWISGYYARPHVTQDMKEGLENQRRKEHANKLKQSLSKRHLRDND